MQQTSTIKSEAHRKGPENHSKLYIEYFSGVSIDFDDKDQGVPKNGGKIIRYLSGKRLVGVEDFEGMASR